MALAAMALNISVLSQRKDGEKIAIVRNADKAVFTFSEPSEVSLFVCLPDDEAEKLEINQPLKSMETPSKTLDVLQMTEPRPLEISPAFAQKHDLDTHVMCTVSPMFNVTPGAAAQVQNENLDPKLLPGIVDLKVSEAVAVPVPENAFVVAAISSGPYPFPEVFLYFVFLVTLWMAGAQGAKAWWQCESSNRPQILKELRFYDAPIAFICALFIAACLSAFVGTRVNANTSSLLPGFWEMTVMLAANFVAFLLTAAFYASKNALKTKKIISETNSNLPTDAEQSKTEAQNIPSTDKLETVEPNVTWKTQLTRLFLRPETPEPFPIWLPLALGIGLALTAVVAVMFAPVPGLSTVEMASQLTSTCLLTAHFAVFAGVSEECLFRGIIQSSLEARQNAQKPALINAVAILITTFLFVLIHVPQSIDHLWALMPIGMVSIVAGWLKLHYRSIFPAILLHMTYNSVLLLPSILA